MKVKDVYQDEQGNWQIDYGVDHLMGLAIRNDLGQTLTQFIISIPMSFLFFMFLLSVFDALIELIPQVDTSIQQIVPQENGSLIMIIVNE
ncbi:MULTISPECIES: hypothetical protein [Moorena]|uniref:Uncharacterized protein n=1 Tax=Moorena producens 3L TaxID=489825 RepID=F4XXJ1_9CYAN|nr:MULTISPECIES: hypothetical protein [Moorena]EGJ30669.1 hypothetical protein LYNGBM3L_48100 [Moorena producens 3L]NEP30905.1 hypothetical protein [Moorena sp. SIO3B2]NEP64608.1 hypothetical protein [Moorena sp. SIO3A5]NEQ11147.1 hypothetical protein [Moorena sp. SIO4E2]NER87708.1 hypothetical protein [Moorena sp. SIO3A2]